MRPLSSTQISHITELAISGLSFRQVHRKTSVGLATISRICSKHLPNLEKSCGSHPAKLSAADIDYTVLNSICKETRSKLLFKQPKCFNMLMGNPYLLRLYAEASKSLGRGLGGR
jgi:hypothetical protein